MLHMYGQKEVSKQWQKPKPQKQQKTTGYIKNHTLLDKKSKSHKIHSDNHKTHTKENKEKFTADI